MAAIAGISGSVTFASGYTTLVSAWEANITQLIQDKTPLGVADNHRQYVNTAAIRGMQGRYSCRLEHTCNSSVDSGPYGNEFAWAAQLSCDVVETTAFGECWRTYEAGLKDTMAQIQSVIDDTTPLNVVGDTGTVELIQDTGTPNESYSFPYIVESEEPGVDVDGDNTITHTLQATGNLTVNGGMPAAGVSGSATLEAYTGRTYSCDIIVTGVSVNVNIRDNSSVIMIDFVADGEVTGA